MSRWPLLMGGGGWCLHIHGWETTNIGFTLLHFFSHDYKHFQKVLEIFQNNSWVYERDLKGMRAYPGLKLQHHGNIAQRCSSG